MLVTGREEMTGKKIPVLPSWVFGEGAGSSPVFNHPKEKNHQIRTIEQLWGQARHMWGPELL